MFSLTAFQFLFLILLSAHLCSSQYQPPEALVEPLTPAGIRISIPDEEGITLVAFHVKFNDEFVGLEAGTIARDIVNQKNGRWTYKDKTTKLKKNDVIYYWVHIVYNGLGYNLVDQEHVVTDFYNYEGQKLKPANTGSQYQPPEALVEPLTPAGIRISIPDEEGITLVAFHVKFNDEFVGLEAGTIARDIVNQKNGRWTYKDKTTKLKKNDVIYYWVHIVYNGLGYNLIDQEHVVTDFYDYEGQKLKPTNTGSNNNGNQPTCTLSATKLFDPTGASRNPCAGQLLFNEDFRDVDQFRRSQWTVVEQFSGAPDYEFVVYRDTRENLNVQNGLKIRSKLLRQEFGDTFVREGKYELPKCTGKLRSRDCYREARGWNILPPVTSSRINTKKSINLEYGRIEIKAKLPRGDWAYPLLMLEPARNSEGSPLDALQIRIASSAGNPDLKLKDGRDISGHILWGGVTGSNSQTNEDRNNGNNATRYNTELWSKGFHVYELNWSPGRIVLKVDGQTYDDKFVNLPTDTPFYLTLGVAVGGLMEFPDDCKSGGYSKTWRNVEAKAIYHFYNTTNTWNKTWQNDTTSLDVDYVKIWAL